MEINGIGQATQTYMAETQRQQETLSAFQAVLEKAEQAAATPNDKEKQQLLEACQGLESYFMQIMFREMRKTTFDENGFIPKSQAEKMFTDMMDEETAKATVKSGGIGLAKAMYQQLTHPVYEPAD